MTSRRRIAPSILAADFANLGADVAALEPHVDLLHVDVMDGHFVPNISLGPPVIQSLRAATDLYLDCHLMITDPLAYLGPLKDSGADGVTIHLEAVPDPEPVLREAAVVGLDCGLVINPPTPVEALAPYVDRVGMVLVMSVHPGYGGQAFMGEVLPKIEDLRKRIDEQGLETDIQIDGGIDLNTVGRAKDAGASVFVAGTALFCATDPVLAANAMRAILDQE